MPRWRSPVGSARWRDARTCRRGAPSPPPPGRGRCRWPRRRVTSRRPRAHARGSMLLRASSGGGRGVPSGSAPSAGAVTIGNTGAHDQGGEEVDFFVVPTATFRVLFCRNERQVLGWLPGPRRPIPPKRWSRSHRSRACVARPGCAARPTSGSSSTCGDQAAHRWINAWSSSFGPALPAPVRPKPSAVPADDGSRFDENEGPAPTRPRPPEPDPEDSIAVLQAHRPLLSLQDHQLLSERQVLERQIPPTPHPRYEGPYRNPDPIPHRHPPSSSRQEPCNLGADGVFATHRFRPSSCSLRTCDQTPLAPGHIALLLCKD